MYLKASELFNKRVVEDGRTFKARMACGQESVDSGFLSIKIYNGSNGADTITIGSTFSQRIEVEMDESNVFLSGKEWFLEMGLMIDDEENFEYIPVGYFTPEKPSTDNGKTSFTAYDRMIKLSGIYVCSIENPTTITVSQDISIKTGVPIDTSGLAEIDMSVPEGLTYREVLAYIAQLYGKFANVSREGIIEFHWWNEVENYKITSDNTNGFKHDETEFVLSYLKFSTGQDEAGNTVEVSVGAGFQGITATNPFMTQTILDNIYSDIGGFAYTVSSVNCPLGDIRLEPWDIVTVIDTKDNSYKVPLMLMEFKYDGGLSLDFSCVGYSETESKTDYKGPAATAAERYEKLLAKAASVEYLEANMAKIDTAVIGDLFANSGVITDLKMVDGYVTGQLNGVKINADVITAGTLAVDRLLVTGKDSIVYQINVESSGLSAEELKDEKYKKYLNGTDIVANSITATQINVKELFSTKITATDLHITGNSTFDGKLNGATGVFSGKLQGGSLFISDEDSGKYFSINEYGELNYLYKDNEEYENMHINNDTIVSCGLNMDINGNENIYSISLCNGFLMTSVLDRNTKKVLYGIDIEPNMIWFNDPDSNAVWNIDYQGQAYLRNLNIYEGISTDKNSLLMPYRIKLGEDDNLGENTGVFAVWEDGNNHYLAVKDGLNSSFGWSGSSEYATITSIRGRTCKVQNASGTSSLSDERLKKDFETMKNWEDFYQSLEPYAFRMKNGNSGRYHMGFKAQQVEEALLNNRLTTNDFAGLVKMKYVKDEDDAENTDLYESLGIKEGDDEYSLIYTEFVALNTYMIQQLMNRVKTLENIVLNTEVSGI